MQSRCLLFLHEKIVTDLLNHTHIFEYPFRAPLLDPTSTLPRTPTYNVNFVCVPRHGTEDTTSLSLGVCKKHGSVGSTSFIKVMFYQFCILFIIIRLSVFWIV